MKVFISGQKYFAEQVLRNCLADGHSVVGVCCPYGDAYIGRLAAINGIPVVNAGALDASHIPADTDLGVAAHSFDYIGKPIRYRARLGWIGYHPSLLPRHRGRSSVEWSIRMGDSVTGGSVYWLNSGVDTGDIMLQDFCFIDPALLSQCPRKAAKSLWRESLQPMGIGLLRNAVALVSSGNIVKKPQDERFATFEPFASPQRLHRPDLLMLPERI